MGLPTADGLICVKDYGAVGNGIQDDTAAVQLAIESNINENDTIGNKKTIYFPDGTYRLTGLSGNVRGILERRVTAEPIWRTGLKIQGESEAGTILRLDDNVFTNASAPRFVIFLASTRAFATSNVPHYLTDGTGLAAYNHNISDLTIDLGTGNTGAIGINAAMHNTSVLRRVTIDRDRSGVGNFSTYAYCGISAERQGIGPAMWERITVRGCQYGVRRLRRCAVIASSTCGWRTRVPSASCSTRTAWSSGAWSRRAPSRSPRSSATSRTTSRIRGALLGITSPHTGGVPIPITTPSARSLWSMPRSPGAARPVGPGDRQSGGQGKMFLRNISTTGYAQAADDNGTAVPGGARSPNMRLCRRRTCGDRRRSR